MRVGVGDEDVEDHLIEQRKGIAINTPTVYIDGRTITA